MTGGLLAVTSIAGVLAGTALASAPAGRSSSGRTAGVVTVARGVTYGGSTSARDPIMVKLSRDGSRVTQLSQQFEATCASGMSYPLVLGPAASIRIDSHGRFRSSLSRASGLGTGIAAHVTATATGKVDGPRLSGTSTLNVEVEDAAGAVTDTCHRTVTFTAVASRGRVFAGVTSQRRPVVIELAASARSVHHFHIGWRAPCTPDGTFSYGDTLTDFTIVKGRFGDDFTQHFTNPVRQVVAYSLHGVIAGHAAEGAFRLTIAGRGATGVATTCKTGPLSYRASSG